MNMQCEDDMTRNVEMSIWYMIYDTNKCDSISDLQKRLGANIFILATGLGR